jgi:protein-S-isoprenylcysteine O-methyltransferase Ste14
MRPPPELPALPPSATDPRIGMVGVGCAALYLVLLVRNPSLTPLMALAGLLAAYALPVLLLEILVRRVHRAPTTGLDWSRPPAPSGARVVLKMIGLIASVASVFAVHALFRFYAFEDLAIPLALFVWLAPGLVVLVPAYVWWVDARQADPQDDYWRLGAILTGRLPLAEAAALRDHALGWAIKGFFLPIMLAYLYHNLGGLHHLKAALSGDMVQLVFGLTLIALMLELAIVCTGYALTLRALDAHIRTPNPYLAAWVVTLAVYEPFNRIITGQVFRYRTETGWVEMVWQNPALTVPWLTVILASYALWVWATAAFGLRWSNLTHRGIITNGPYRWTKHPDYVSKITFFWFGAAPFLTAATPWAAVAGTAALVVVTGIYWGRARMEERHLSHDPVYVAYALAMNERSLFAPLARRWPWLAYVPPADARPDPAHPSDKPRILRRGTIVTVRPAE